MSKKSTVEDLEPVLGADPLNEPDDALTATFFGASPAVDARTARKPARKRKRSVSRAAVASHYKIVSISLYNEDIERIDALVSAWKDAGNPKANRSALIRYAIEQIDPSSLPKGY
jgi:hypothetical protein